MPSCRGRLVDRRQINELAITWVRKRGGGAAQRYPQSWGVRLSFRIAGLSTVRRNVAGVPSRSGRKDSSRFPKLPAPVSGGEGVRTVNHGKEGSHARKSTGPSSIRARMLSVAVFGCVTNSEHHKLQLHWVSSTAVPKFSCQGGGSPGVTPGGRPKESQANCCRSVACKL